MAAAAIEETDYPSTGQRWAILFTLTLSVTLYGLTVLVVTVLLPQMQGALSATQDQIAWVMTFNILATAVVTPMTGWLAARFGRKRVMLGGTLGFTLATVGCGGADPRTRITELLTERAEAYGRFPQVATDGRPPTEIAVEIEALVRDGSVG